MQSDVQRFEPTLTRRPIISDVVEDASGRSFTVQFAPFQQLPDHKNRARIVILAVAGSGVLTVEGMAPRTLTAGDVVQLDPNVLHSVASLGEPLELRVMSRANCCESC